MQNLIVYHIFRLSVPYTWILNIGKLILQAQSQDHAGGSVDYAACIQLHARQMVFSP